MNGISLRDPQLLVAFTAAGLCIGGVFAWKAMRKVPSEEELERLRRDALVKVGRIIDGTILDICDVDPEASGRPSRMQLILYKYEISGVTYECSQDVSGLAGQVNIYDCRVGFPCSVRYDPRRPASSIIVAESWSGLRDTANPVCVHPPGAAQPA
jgi:hypothetical protein